MRNVAMVGFAGVVLVLAGCSPAATAPAESRSPDSDPEPVAAAVATPSVEPTFWDLAPLGDGAHVKVQIEDRAKVEDCAALHEIFARIAGDDRIDGYTDEALTYVDEHMAAAGCGTTGPAATSPSPSPSASATIATP